MKFLHDKRRAGVIAVLAAVLGTAALFLGAGGAQATGMCGENGNVGDTTVGVTGLFYVGVNQESVGTPHHGFYACAIPPGAGVGVGLRDPNPSTPGASFEAVIDEPGPTFTGVGLTGAEVSPATATNAPASGAAGTGGSVGTGPGTCAYANGSATCPFGAFTIAGLTVAEGDASAGVHPNPGGCVTLNGGCLTTVPSGVGVSAGKGDPTNPTVDGQVAGGPVTQDIGKCYVGVNAPSSC